MSTASTGRCSTSCDQVEIGRSANNMHNPVSAAPDSSHVSSHSSTRTRVDIPGAANVIVIVDPLSVSRDFATGPTGAPRPRRLSRAIDAGRRRPMAQVKITASDGSGTFDALLVEPAGKPAGAVVLIQEIFGVNDAMQATAAQVAALGFFAIAPDLFWRLEP